MNCYDDSNNGRIGTVCPGNMRPRPWNGNNTGSFLPSLVTPVSSSGNPMSAHSSASSSRYSLDMNREHFPIAMGYVPWQTWQQPYPLEQGFRKGTIFPELDLPFLMGRCR